ncbi:hypothetical protein SDC9_148403 [bioreactor metagenome]|uniref:Uncharacterized protein n=1 Tax=bioreactor metagenome TaxID=1076179 RepID=A0A645EHG7_9ZZZZ
MISSVFFKNADICSGRRWIPSTAAAYSSPETVPNRLPRYSPTRSISASWVEYALVVATAISGPAQVYSTSSASRAIEDPTTLTMARVRPPRRLASRMAAMVSSVSPDWLMTTTRDCSSTSGSQYRNSLANTTSTGRRSSFSQLYLLTMPTW